jgi:zinc transporter ZupT
MPTLEQYQNMLRINKLRLDDELEIQAELQHAISMEVARLNTLDLEAENKLKSTDACGWSFAQWAGAFFTGLLFSYLVARLVSAAYFKSKHDHETKGR